MDNADVTPPTGTAIPSATTEVNWFNPHTHPPRVGEKLLCFSDGLSWFGVYKPYKNSLGEEHLRWCCDVAGEVTPFPQPFLYAYLSEVQPEG